MLDEGGIAHRRGQPQQFDVRRLPRGDPVAVAVDHRGVQFQPEGGFGRDVAEHELGARPGPGILRHPDFVPGAARALDVAPAFQRRPMRVQIRPAARIARQIHGLAPIADHAMEVARRGGAPAAEAAGVPVRDQRPEQFRSFRPRQCLPVRANEHPIRTGFDADPNGARVAGCFTSRDMSKHS